MNLFELLRRNDRALVIDGDVSLAKTQIDNQTWRGLRLGQGAAFRIVDARRFASFRAFSESCGWVLFARPGTALRLSVVQSDEDKWLGSRVYEGEFQSLLIPWPKAVMGRVDLLAESIGNSSEGLFVAGHKALSRQWMIDMAVGNGIEIGPGPQPQILPQDGRRVSYLEQMPPEEWNRLYNRSGKYPVRPDLWSNYFVGNASELPVPDGSLDFIFGSHVFEHLANPLGHLKRWHTKLASGGKIICVVPDLAGTHDAVQERSALSEWLAELDAEVWQPTEHHYSRHLRREPSNKHVRMAMEQERSVHAHYYDNINCRDLLEYAVRELGYADYVIEHTPNHKDFHFVLQKG